MTRLALVVLVGLMTFSTSGLLDLAVPEPCPLGESSSEPDADCAATCVRCGCCAQGIELLTIKPVSTAIRFVAAPGTVFELALQGDPAEVLHVPRPLAA